jgi:tetratricopeptide (TPR) repeat protein
MICAMGAASRSLAYATLVLAAVAGCDSRAKASDPQAARAEAKSREYESCGASMHCQDELRCFEHVCRRGARSSVGDYYAALGAANRQRGELEAAIDAYNRALGHYDSEKIAPPPDVDCAYGSTLAAARKKKEHAELGARVLHRCVLAVPVGSPLRERALADLALLAEAGLDPLTLGRSQLADVYLTRAPQRPSADRLSVHVTATPPVDKKTFPLIPERLGQADVKAPLVACWETYNAATRKEAMAVTIGLKWQYLPSEYEDEPGRYQPRFDPASSAAGPDGIAETCVRAAVEPALKALTSVRDAFTTRLTIAVK